MQYKFLGERESSGGIDTVANYYRQLRLHIAEWLMTCCRFSVR